MDFTEARDSEWQWHQLGHVQVCTSLQTDNHASTPPLSFLQAGCASCHPTNSVKALMAFIFHVKLVRKLHVSEVTARSMHVRLQPRESGLYFSRVVDKLTITRIKCLQNFVYQKSVPCHLVTVSNCRSSAGPTFLRRGGFKSCKTTESFSHFPASTHTQESNPTRTEHAEFEPSFVLLPCDPQNK